MRILVVEDDPLLGDALQAGLRQRGFDADWVKDGIAAELALRGDPLPQSSSISACRASMASKCFGVSARGARTCLCSCSPRATPSTIG